MAAINIRSLSKEQHRAIIGVSCILGLSLSVVFSSFKSKQHNGTQYVGSVRRSLFSSEGVEWAPHHPKKRLALIRPFSIDDGQKLLESFSLWDDWWPCSAEDNEYDIDLVLSYSRRFNNNEKEDLDAKLASDIVQEIRSKFIASSDDGWGWSECFAGLRVIEADLDVSILLSCIILVLQFIYTHCSSSCVHHVHILCSTITSQPSKDKYEKHSHTGSPESLDWVSGPNGQFRSDMSKLMENTDVQYELAMIMEADNQPRHSEWLNKVIEDVQDKAPFAILGSKYKGNAWDGMKDIMPASLLNHINGNALVSESDNNKSFHAKVLLQLILTYNIMFPPSCFFILVQPYASIFQAYSK